MCIFNSNKGMKKMGFYIGKIKIDGSVVLAPMAGVTNLAYRQMCKKYHAALVYSEMISDKGIFYHDKKTLALAKIDKNEHPIAIQIFGGDLDTLLYAAKFVDQNTEADIIDINMGCSVPKILKSNAGSAYLLDPDRIYKTVKTIVENVKKPVTVKIRIGWDHQHINALEVAKKIKEAGASALAIHGRTKSDLYRGNVNYQIIKEIKENLKDFPIIVNGDITTPQKAKEILEYTQCDAVMIGRASYGNPYIFKQIDHYLKTGELLPNLTLKEKIQILKDYSKELIALKGEYTAIRELRQQAGWFLKDFKQSAQIRKKVSLITSYDELLQILKALEQ